MPRDKGAGTASLGPDHGPRGRDDVPAGLAGVGALVRGAFRTLVFGQALGQLGDGLTQIAFAQLVVFDIGRGASPGAEHRVGSSRSLCCRSASSARWAEFLIDRWDRRRTLIIASLCRASLAAVAIAAAAWRSEVLAYAGVVLLLSSSRFVLDAKGAVLPRTVEARELVRANAISGLIGMTAAIIGAVGGAMFVSWSVMAGFLAGAGAYIAASACFARLPAVGGGTRTATVAAVVVQLARELAGAAGDRADTDLRRPLTAVSLHRLLLGAGFVLLVLVADQRYHLQASGYGLAIAVTGAAAVVGTVSAPWVSGRWPPRVLLPLAFLPPAAAVAVVGYAPSLASLVCAVAVAAVSFQSLKDIADALVGRNSPDEVRGRVFAIYDVLYNVAFVLAGLLMIPLWQLGREQALAWWLASGFFVGWLVMARMTRAWPFRPGRGDLRGGRERGCGCVGPRRHPCPADGGCVVQRSCAAPSSLSSSRALRCGGQHGSSSPLADRDPARTERPRGCSARLVGGGGIPTHGPLLAAAEHYGVPAGDRSVARPSVAALGSAVLAPALR